MIGRVALACLAAAVLTIVPALIEGHYFNRWGAPADLTAAAKQVEAFPKDFGAWTFVDEGDKLSDMVCNALGLSGYLSRSYTHRESGAMANILLMVGQPGPLLRHPPNICYANRANEQVGETTKFQVDVTQPPSEFKLLEFQRPDSITKDRFFVAYAMATGPNWQAPDSPRITFGAAPLLYKVQFLLELNSAKDHASQLALLKAFAADFCREFERCVQSPSSDQVTAATGEAIAR